VIQSIVRRRVSWLVSVIAAIFVSGIMLASNASAASCPAGQPCFWPDSNRGGNWVFSGTSNWVGDAYNDKATSFENRGSHNYIWRWDVNCGGNIAMILSPGAWQNASWWNNDETSSVCNG
jgi:hypothetical protein